MKTVPERCVLMAKVGNRLGLHARPAMSLVDLAGAYTSTVTIRKGTHEVDGKSIMQVMMLAATQGTELEIVCEGVDAEAAAKAIKHLIDSGFDED